MLPFARPDISSEEYAAVKRVLESGWLTTGPKTEEFESSFAEAVGANHAVALHSCTAALHLSSEAWGLGEGDAVILPSITFTATASIFEHSGCLPLIIDVDRDTYLLSAKIVETMIQKECRFDKPTNRLIHQKTGRRLQALVPVHLGGRPCEMDELEALGEQFHLKILHDAAHAFPSEYKNQRIGSLKDATAFSFYATKNLTTGEGGMLTTNDLQLAEKIRCMRSHGIQGQTYGQKRGYDVVCKGYKYNMSDINAALGLVQLQRAQEMWDKRQRIHLLYEKELASIPWIQKNPYTPHTSSYHLYVIEIKPNPKVTRDYFVEEMYSRNIELSLHFIPLYRFTHYQKKYKLNPSSFPHSEAIYQNIVSLPIYSSMSMEDAKDVVRAIQNILC